MKTLTNKNLDQFKDYLIHKLDKSVIQINFQKSMNDFDCFHLWDILLPEMQTATIKDYYKSLSIIIWSDYNVSLKKWNSIAIDFNEGLQLVLVNHYNNNKLFNSEEEALQDVFTHLNNYINTKNK